MCVCVCVCAFTQPQKLFEVPDVPSFKCVLLLELSTTHLNTHFTTWVVSDLFIPYFSPCIYPSRLYIYIYIYIYTYMPFRLSSSISSFPKCTSRLSHFLYIYIYIYIYINMCVCVCVCAFSRLISIHLSIYIYKCTYIYNFSLDIFV